MNTLMVNNKAKKKPASGKKIYFDESVEEAIKQYLHSSDYKFKNDIYERKIYPAFMKIAENVVNIFGVYKIKDTQDVMDEIVVHLTLKMDKFDETCGSKAFSYFTVAAKNYVFQLFKKNQYQRKFWDDTRNKQILELDKTPCVDPEEIIERSDFITGLIYELSCSIGQYPNEAKVIRAVISILEDNIVNKKDLLDIYSRKGVYIYLREMTRMDTKRIARVMSKIRKRYADYKERYLNGEVIMNGKNMDGVQMELEVWDGDSILKFQIYESGSRGIGRNYNGPVLTGDSRMQDIYDYAITRTDKSGDDEN